MEKKHIRIYSDGACSGNPGPGGWATIVKVNDFTMYQNSEGYPRTTNNRMELTGAIMGLRISAKVNPDEVGSITVYSDSRYLCDAKNEGWLDNWIKRGWSRPGGGYVKNVDLWEQLLEAEKNLRQKVEYVWIKGHNGHPENEECDRLAVEAYEDFVGVNYG